MSRNLLICSVLILVLGTSSLYSHTIPISSRTHNNVKIFDNYEEEHNYHKMHPLQIKAAKKPTLVESELHWINDAQSVLRSQINQKKIEGKAKNIIFFLGDGMSIPTLAATRAFKGQKAGSLYGGEETKLYFEQFPYTGLSKTFCSDAQVADSACSATAYLSGSKANIGTIGVTPTVTLGDCAGQNNKDNHLPSVLAWAQNEGLSTGIVTTTRITHASPAGTYAHISHRDFEYDKIISDMEQDSETCDDIAEQLILSDPGKNIDVILGGGRRYFVNNTISDPESGTGLRVDGKNLIETWKSMHPEGNYITNATELLSLNTSSTKRLLGLFAPSHINYYDEIEEGNDPTLAQMTQVAIEILSKNENGFFLFVEGGRIDHAHHDNWAHRAFVETLEFEKAIGKGDAMTNDEETLIVVTSDHSHVMTMSGYPTRGTDILSYDPVEQSGKAQDGGDGKPYATISYANGLGYRDGTYNSSSNKCERVNIANDPFSSPTYRQVATVPLDFETHGGDDVGIFAKGPWAHLLVGVHYQSYIPHVMGYAACIGPGLHSCA